MELLYWIKQQRSAILSKTEFYSVQEKINIKSDYLIKVIDIVIPNIRSDQEIIEVRRSLEDIIAMLPEKQENSGNIKYDTRLVKKIDNFRSYINKKYKYVDKESILGQSYIYGIVLGIALSPVVGLMLEKMSLGICFGVAIGVAMSPGIKKYYTDKATKEGRLL